MKESKRDGSADALGQGGKDAGREDRSTWKARPHGSVLGTYNIIVIGSSGSDKAEGEGTLWNGAVRGI